MKVLHIVPSNPYGGAQRSVALLAGQQRQKGIDARVLGVYHNDILARFMEQHEVPYYTMKTLKPWDIRGWMRLAMLVKNIAPDIIHLHMALLWNLIILSMPYMKKIPLVFHFRQSAPKVLTFKDRAIRGLLRYNIDAVIGVSLFATNNAKKYFDYDSFIYRTIYNGIFIPEAVPRPNNEPDFMGHVSFSRPIIGMASRIGSGKGIKEFLEAIPCISEYLPDARFVLAGEGPLLSWAKEYSASLGVSDVLILPGFIQDIARFWSYLDFALFTSPEETFGLSVIESQIANTVVVGYLNGSGSDEIIISGETGILVPWGAKRQLAEEIAALWADRERYNRMAMAARQRVEEHFNIEKTARRCLELYEEVLMLKRSS